MKVEKDNRTKGQQGNRTKRQKDKKKQGKKEKKDQKLIKLKKNKKNYKNTKGQKDRKLRGQTENMKIKQTGKRSKEQMKKHVTGNVSRVICHISHFFCY